MRHEMMIQCGNCEKTGVELKTCGRCQSVAYCSLKCQRESWSASHKSVCRQKIRLSDEVPSEVRDKPWAHEFMVVREFLKDKCQVDSREIRQLSEDEDLVHELYAKITEHLARSDLTKALISSRSSATESALANRARLSSSHVAKYISKNSLPPSAADALKDICAGGRLLPTPVPPLPCHICEAVVKVANEEFQASKQNYRLDVDISQLKRDIVAVEKKESRELIDPAVVTEKAGYKRLQTEISNLEKKSCEYDDRVAKMTKELKHAGFHDKLTHEKITADAEALTAKQAEVEEDQDRVSVFHGLPANLPLAKVALEEKKRKLSELKDAADGLMG